MGIYDKSVAFRSRQNEIRDIGLQGEQDLPVGFGERFTVANKITYDRYTPVGRARVTEDKYKARDELLVNLGVLQDGESLMTQQRLIDRANSGNYPSLKSDFLGRNMNGIPGHPDLSFSSLDDLLKENQHKDEVLAQAIKDNPNAGILSDEEIGANIMMDQVELLRQDQDLTDRSTLLGKVGFVAGSMIGWIRDPTHAASSVVGLSPVGRASLVANFFRVAKGEAALVSVLELSEKGQEVAFRRKFGEEDLTDVQALVESGISIAGAGVIGGSIGAVVGKFLRPIPTSRNASNNAVTETTQEVLNRFRKLQEDELIKSQGIKSTVFESLSPEQNADVVGGRVFGHDIPQKGIRNNPLFDPEIQQAADLLDETLQIARGAPDNVSYETHMSNYAEARRNIADGENIKVGVDDFNKVIRDTRDEVAPPFGSESITPEATIEARTRSINSLRETLAKGDVTLSREEGSGITATSSREFIAELDSDDAAVRATINCLG